MCDSNEMYKEVFNKDGSAKHSHECTMSFGRKDHKCHRCVEILTAYLHVLDGRKGTMKKNKNKNRLK